MGHITLNVNRKFQCLLCGSEQLTELAKVLQGQLVCNSCFLCLLDRPLPEDEALFALKLSRRAARMRCEPTIAESHLWQELSKSPEWHTQEPVTPFIADFLHIPTSTIVEVDGSYHQLAKAADKDRRRTEYLSKHGYAVIRFSNKDVMGCRDAVLQRIDAVVEYRRSTVILIDNRPRRRTDKVVIADGVAKVDLPKMRKKWTGRAYVLTAKPDVMAAIIPPRRISRAR